MTRAVKAIIMSVGLSFLALLALAPAPVADHPTAAVASVAAVGSPVAGPSAAGSRDRYSPPSAMGWPSVRFADRNRSRRGASGDVFGDLHGDVHVNLTPVVSASSDPCPAAVPIDGPRAGRLPDLRALSGPRVLRVVRS